MLSQEMNLKADRPDVQPPQPVASAGVGAGVATPPPTRVPLHSPVLFLLLPIDWQAPCMRSESRIKST